MYADTGSPFPTAASHFTHSCPPTASPGGGATDSAVGADGTDAAVEYSAGSDQTDHPTSFVARTRNPYTSPGVSFFAWRRTDVLLSAASVIASHTSSAVASSPAVEVAPLHTCTSYPVMSRPHPDGATHRILSAVRVREESTGGAGRSGGEAIVANTPLVSNIVSAPWQGLKVVRAIASTRYSRPGARPEMSQRYSPSSERSSFPRVRTLR
mmetsp:Transcript_49611/g.117233  ORF Transcript_49611/g.117233 Transcript_49611/m.117233 type:complete len:211 (-) Transcript_49611:105-737(-)